MDFNKLNEELYQLSMNHRFPTKRGVTKCDEGYIRISDWLNELCYFFEKQRETQEILNEEQFKSVVNLYRKKVEKLPPSEYKDGLLKALSEV